MENEWRIVDTEEESAKETPNRHRNVEQISGISGREWMEAEKIRNEGHEKRGKRKRKRQKLINNRNNELFAVCSGLAHRKISGTQKAQIENSSDIWTKPHKNSKKNSDLK